MSKLHNLMLHKPYRGDFSGRFSCHYLIESWPSDISQYLYIYWFDVFLNSQGINIFIRKTFNNCFCWMCIFYCYWKSDPRLSVWFYLRRFMAITLKMLVLR
jgi:hypothetical protein